jgi:predicted amidohydrolase
MHFDAKRMRAFATVERRHFAAGPAGAVQAAEDDSGLSDSVLETPVYVLALVFFLFLAVSLLFEHGVHALTHACKMKQRPGLGG